MSTTYNIPLTPSQPQQFLITLNGVTYTFVLKFNLNANAWVLDISDSQGNLIVGGIALVTGTDLLAQYSYLNFGGQLIASTPTDPLNLPATFDDLGVTSIVQFVVP